MLRNKIIFLLSWIILGFALNCFAENDLDAWKKAGFEPAEIDYCIKRNLTLLDIKEWKANGFSVIDAEDWIRRSVTIQDAIEWKKISLSVSDAIKWRENNFTPFSGPFGQDNIPSSLRW